MQTIPLEKLIGNAKPGLYTYSFYPDTNTGGLVGSTTTGAYLGVTGGKVRVRLANGKYARLALAEVRAAAEQDQASVQTLEFQRTVFNATIARMEKEIITLKQQLAHLESLPVSILDPADGIYTAMVPGFETRRIADSYEAAFAVIKEISQLPGSCPGGTWVMCVTHEYVSPVRVMEDTDVLSPVPAFIDEASCQSAINKVGPERVRAAWATLSGNRS